MVRTAATSRGLVCLALFVWMATKVPLFGQDAQSPTPPITAMCFSPDGTSLLVASQRGLTVLKWPTLEIDRTNQVELDHIHDLKFAPDGDRILVAGGSPGEVGTIQLRAWPMDRMIMESKVHDDLVYQVAWHPKGTSFVSASWDGTCRVFQNLNAPDGATNQSYLGHSAPVFAVTYLDDGKVVSAGADSTIQIWEPDNPSASRTLRHHSGPIHDLLLSKSMTGSDSMLVSISEDRTVRFWTPSIGRMLRFRKLPSVPRSMVWSPDGKSLLVGCDDGRICALDFETLQSRDLHHGSHTVEAMARDQSGNRIVFAAQGTLLRLSQ